MQTLLVEEIVLTFVGDAHALTAGFARVLFKIVTAPIERLAKACDVAGVLAKRKTACSGSRRRISFSFHHLNHLT